MVFITCGLGGGTGTGGAPEVARVAKRVGALTIGVVTLPFTIEGRKRIENAMDGLEKMESMVDTLIVIPNDKLLELAPELPLHTAFKISDEILTNAVKGVTELVTVSGLVNLDFADIKTIMLDGGVSLIGMGESDTEQRALDAVGKAIQNPLLDVDISDATGALVNIIGGNDMSLDECKDVIESIGQKLSPDAKLIWGAQISADMEKSVRVLLIVTGVKSSQILGQTESIDSLRHKEIEEELGIEFFE
jgi:cell division protein FtsZ